MKCKWLAIGEGKDAGKCVQAKDDCNELAKKECAKAKMCDYNKKNKSCMGNFKSKCVGIKTDTHGKCYHVETKEDCMKVKSMFNKPLCKWGYNKFDDAEKDKVDCVKDTGMKIGKSCT